MEIIAPNFVNVMGCAQPKLQDQIPFYNTSKVRKALRKISSVYQKLRQSNGRIDWKDPVFRCAYVFLYFPKHSHLVFAALRQNRCHFESSWRHKYAINVCSIGGGPGSDIAGVMAFLSSINICSSLQCSVLDIFPEWESSWRAIEPHVPSKIQRTNVTYRKFDLLQEPPFSDEVVNIIGSSDLVTFVKSFSAVSTESVMYSAVLPSLVNALKPGAFVLFIDNSPNQVKNDAFKELFLKAGFHLVHTSNEGNKLLCPTNTYVDGLETEFKYRPMRYCPVTTYLLHKPSMSFSRTMLVPLLYPISGFVGGLHKTFTQTSTNLLKRKLSQPIVKRLTTRLKNGAQNCNDGLILQIGLPRRRRSEVVCWSDIDSIGLRLRGRLPMRLTSYETMQRKLGIRRDLRQARSHQRRMQVRHFVAIADVLGLFKSDFTSA